MAAVATGDSVAFNLVVTNFFRTRNDAFFVYPEDSQP